MDEKQETSPSGALIHRYETPDRDFEAVAGDSEHMELISDHIEEHIGPVANVFHEIISDRVHIDIHIVEPSEDRPFYTLVSSGMSDLPMKAPEGLEDSRYSELMLCLPPSWPLEQDALSDENNYWPIRLLKTLCRLPHDYDAWLWMMHTVPHGNPATPYAENTDMTGAILFPALTAPDAFDVLEVNDEKSIHFHSVVPLHSDEMDLKLERGSDALVKKLNKCNVTELLDAERASSLRKKGLFGFLGR